MSITKKAREFSVRGIRNLIYDNSTIPSILEIASMNKIIPIKVNIL